MRNGELGRGLVRLYHDVHHRAPYRHAQLHLTELRRIELDARGPSPAHGEPFDVKRDHLLGRADGGAGCRVSRGRDRVHSRGRRHGLSDGRGSGYRDGPRLGPQLQVEARGPLRLRAVGLARASHGPRCGKRSPIVARLPAAVLQAGRTIVYHPRRGRRCLDHRMGGGARGDGNPPLRSGGTQRFRLHREFERAGGAAGG